MCKNFHLSPSDVEFAENYLMRLSQLEFFPAEIHSMQKLKIPLADCQEPRQSYIRQYNPFFDETGLIRSRSRLAKFESIYGFDKIYPIILHRKSEIARLIVEQAHIEDGHVVGLQAMKSKIQSRFEIHGLGTLCRVVKAKCLSCTIRKAKPFAPLMGELPTRRVEILAPAFTNTGIDFAGPFSLKVGKRKARKTSYILVMTCLTTRAVHLEATEGMTTSDVIMALKRFCCYRGTPKTITSDNQTSFHKADRDLREWAENLDFNKIQEATGMGFTPKSFGIKWHFLPPHAPHMGGVYETIVKATKRAMMAIMEKADLDEVQFRTLVSEVNMRLNDRPIKVMSDSSEDLPPLTPNDFLITRSSNLWDTPADLDLKSIDEIKERWKLVQILQNHFWERFHTEITPMLRNRTKWCNEEENVKVGDIVLEISKDSPRRSWQKFYVHEAKMSPDGKVREVVVRGSNNHLYPRPIHNFIPIVRN